MNTQKIENKTSAPFVLDLTDWKTTYLSIKFVMGAAFIHINVTGLTTKIKKHTAMTLKTW